jgi:hypothetical protein
VSEAVSLDFLGRRLDSVQNDVRDLRLRVVGLADRFGTMERRFATLENRFATIEARFSGVEERIATMETRLDRMVFLIERMAQAQGIKE